jgi:hypothetical protein
MLHKTKNRGLCPFVDELELIKVHYPRIFQGFSWPKILGYSMDVFKSMDNHWICPSRDLFIDAYLKLLIKRVFLKVLKNNREYMTGQILLIQCICY